MGGSSRSSQKAEGDLAFNNIDYGQGGGGGSGIKNLNIGRGNSVGNIEVTDGKAFQVVDNVAKGNIDLTKTVLSEAIRYAGQANKQSQEAVQQTTRQFTDKFSEFASRTSTDDDQRVQDLAKWGIGAMAVLTAYNVYSNRKG